MRLGPQRIAFGGIVLLLSVTLPGLAFGSDGATAEVSVSADSVSVDSVSEASVSADGVAETAALEDAIAEAAASDDRRQRSAVHPLQPVLRQASLALERFDQQIQDYECLLIKRERIGGQLTPHQFLRVKIRQRQDEGDVLRTPLSIYARFLKPSDVEGRELLYVENQRNGDLLARRGGRQLPNLTLQLDPLGKLAMSQSRYPITHIGIRKLITQMIQRVEEQMKFSDCDVRYFDKATLDGRPCDHIVVRHPAQQPDRPFHTVRVLIDQQLQLPVYFASYSRPNQPDGPPVLEEEYVYTQLTLNPGFTDRDFDRDNPEYQFLKLTPERTAAK